MRARAQTFANRYKGLGQLERTNVKWPKAPLNAPAMRRDDDADAPESGVWWRTPNTNRDSRPAAFYRERCA